MNLLNRLEKVASEKGAKDVQKGKGEGQESFTKVLEKMARKLKDKASDDKSKVNVEQKFNEAAEKAKDSLKRMLESLIGSLKNGSKSVSVSDEKDVPELKRSNGKISGTTKGTSNKGFGLSQKWLEKSEALGNRNVKDSKSGMVKEEPFRVKANGTEEKEVILKMSEKVNDSESKHKNAVHFKETVLGAKKIKNEKNVAEKLSQETRQLERTLTAFLEIQGDVVADTNRGSKKIHGTSKVQPFIGKSTAQKDGPVFTITSEELSKIVRAINDLLQKSEYLVVVKEKKKVEGYDKFVHYIRKIQSDVVGGKKAPKVLTVKELVIRIEREKRVTHQEAPKPAKIKIDIEPDLLKVKKLTEKLGYEKAYLKNSPQKNNEGAYEFKDEVGFKGLESRKGTVVSGKTPGVQERVSMDELIERVERSARMASKTESFRERAFFKLEPPKLGNVEVELVKKGQDLQVVFRVESIDAKRLIEKRIEHLSQRLEAQGFNVDRIEVKVEKEQQERGDRWQDEERGQQEENDQNRRRRKDEKEGDKS